VKSKSGNGLVDGIRVTCHESGSEGPTVEGWPGNPRVITLMFCLQGKLSIEGNGISGAWELSDNQHNIYFTRETYLKISVRGMQVKWVTVQFNKKSFLSLADTTDAFVKLFVDQILADEQAAFSGSPLPIELVLMNCIHSILNCNYPDSLKRMFVFSKAVELFVLQAESLGRSTGRKVTYLKKEYDRERILFARDYLVKHMENPPTLPELSRLAGINEFKLKKGFKETFNQPVFAWLADVRLETARNELMKKSKSVTEIAFELGYSSPQHFSTAFKRKFGVTPTISRCSKGF
jgi:AraC family transcriptional regulator, transcriptional activator of the genes for pyochelin and ferripyochelin receptors